MFNARSPDHWKSLYTLEEVTKMDYIGCYPMEYSANSVVQDSRQGSLKTDYVLLYGKAITDIFKKSINELFRLVEEWSTEYPTNGTKIS